MTVDRFYLRSPLEVDEGMIHDNACSVLIDSETGFIASDGGEPEDQLFCRDWDWVLPLLNKISKETTSQKISQEMLCQQVVDILNSKDNEISREMVDKLFRAVMKKFSDRFDPVDPVYPWEI